MKFELDFFEKFIQRELTASRARRIIPDFVKKRDEVYDGVERIKKTFRTQLFSFDSENKFEQYIQYHQSHIITLANQILTSLEKYDIQNIDTISNDHTRINLCKVLYKGLKELLTYIEKYFSKYFNQDDDVPLSYAIICVEEVNEKIEAIRSHPRYYQLDPLLFDVLLLPIAHFKRDSKQNAITFRSLIYIKQLLREFEILLAGNSTSNLNDEVCRMLCYMNFNSYHFLTYLTKKISDETGSLTTVTDQIDRLSFFVKEYNQLNVKPGFSLKPNRATIQHQVVTWLEEEIYYVEKKRQLTLMIPPSKTSEISDFKINTSLSVSQMAFYLRLLIEAGVVTNTNQVEIIRFISKNFSSARNESISAESLRRKYYNAERSTVTSVQDILHKLIDESRKLSVVK